MIYDCLSAKQKNSSLQQSDNFCSKWYNYCVQTISSHVQQYMQTRPFLSKYLAGELLNYRALARRIKPHIEQQTGESVSIEAIAISLRRLGTQLQTNQRPIGTLHGIQIIPNLTLINMNHADECQSIQLQPKLPQEFCEIITGVDSSLLIVSTSLYGRFETNNILHNPTTKINEMNALVLHQTDQQASSHIGRLYYPLGVLAENNIPVLASTATLSEQLLFIEERYTDVACKLLRASLIL